MVKFTEIEIRELATHPTAIQIVIDYHENEAAGAEACEAIEIMQAHDARIEELEMALVD